MWQRLNETDVLVIDEISMIENLHFERINFLLKAARGSKEAFGGVQLVVTGDVRYPLSTHNHAKSLVLPITTRQTFSALHNMWPRAEFDPIRNGV